MEKEHLFAALYGSYNTPLRKVKSLKNYYQTFDEKDISKMNIGILNKALIELKEVLEDLEFDYKSYLGNTPYTNAELREWIQLYYKNLIFMKRKYELGQFIITADDIPDDYETDIS